MRPLTFLVLAVAVASLSPPLPAARGDDADEPLVCDQSLRMGTLDNGLRWVVARHANPAGRIAIWLHVGTGSLNETDGQRGIAHFLEHMAFNGSENFPPGSVVPYFQALGLRFGSDQNAFTNYFETTYQLALPDAEPKTIGKAMLFFSDVAGRLSLLPQEIDDERQIILEEKRARGGGATRIRELIAERLTPGSTYGRRLPIGVEEQIRAFTEADFRDYWSRWYVPSAMTVIAVGDADPAAVVEQIGASFGTLPKRPREAPREAGVQPSMGRRALVATDPEITTCDVSFVRVAPPRPPSTMLSRWRSDLVETLGARAFGRRLQRLTASGKASFLAGDASIRDSNAMTTYRVHARAVPRQWRRNLADLGDALQTARLHGFGEREIAAVSEQMLADADEAVDREPTLPARDLVTRINGAVGRDEPILSAQQRRDLMARLLPTIGAGEVSAAFAGSFDTTNGVFLLEMASNASPPTEEEYLAAAAAAFDVTPQAQAEDDRAETLLEAAPPGGKVAEEALDSASGVWSAWLDNGVRLHHRFMDVRRHEVTVTITLAGGTIEETADDRGISDAAALAWKRPSAGKLTNEQVRDLLVGKKVHTSAASGEDTMTLTLSGDPADLEEGLKLAFLLLTEPNVESRALGGWQQSERQAIASRSLSAVSALAETVADSIFPRDEVRTKPLGAEQLKRLSSGAAQAFLRRLVAQAPIEVAIVGDMLREDAAALAVRYLGALPPRPRISEATLADRRRIARPAGPLSASRLLDVTTREATVLAGFFGPDPKDGDDARLLQLAARILSTRMTQAIREQKQLVYSIRANLRPSVLPGYAMFSAQAPTDPAKAAALADAIEEIYDGFAKDGPSGEEMTVAKRQLANQIAEDSVSPAWWSGLLATLDYRGLGLERALSARGAYERFTQRQVREAFARWYVPQNRYRFVVKPKD